MTRACPCGSGDPDATCCDPILAGTRPAATALALMRSRYTAYVRSDVEYLLATHAPDPDARAEGRPDAAMRRREIERFTRSTLWLGLEILATERGGTRDREGVVEFVAAGVTGGRPFRQHERSRFRRDAAGAWQYVAGELR